MEFVNPASLDVRLGNNIMVEVPEDRRLHLLELLCARDLRQFVVDPSQVQAGEVDAMIAAAAERMNKTKADFGGLLAKRRAW